MGAQPFFFSPATYLPLSALRLISPVSGKLVSPSLWVLVVLVKGIVGPKPAPLPVIVLAAISRADSAGRAAWRVGMRRAERWKVGTTP